MTFSTIQPAERFSRVSPPIRSNPIPSGDGQINRSALICVAYVLTLDWDQRSLDPLYTSFHLSAEWRERMERSWRGHWFWPANQLDYCKNKEAGREVTAVGAFITFCVPFSCISFSLLSDSFGYFHSLKINKTSDLINVDPVTTFRKYNTLSEQRYFPIRCFIYRRKPRSLSDTHCLRLSKQALVLIPICWKFPNVLFYRVWFGRVGCRTIHDSLKNKQPGEDRRGIIWETCAAKETTADFKQI